MRPGKVGSPAEHAVDRDIKSMLVLVRLASVVLSIALQATPPHLLSMPRCSFEPPENDGLEGRHSSALLLGTGDTGGDQSCRGARHARRRAPGPRILRILSSSFEQQL